MSDQSTGARPATERPMEAAGQAAGEVKQTAARQAQRVGAEARTQARHVATDVRDRLGAQARQQNDRLVSGIRQAAGQLDEMRSDRTDGPAATVVARVADSGRQLADYLDQHGPDGVLQELQDFARRRPGAFLATALAAGFVVGRLGKSIAKADPNAGIGKPDTDAYATRYTPPTQRTESSLPAPAGYPQTGTEYAATGTGRPSVVDEGQEFRP